MKKRVNSLFTGGGRANRLGAAVVQPGKVSGIFFLQSQPIHFR